MKNHNHAFLFWLVAVVPVGAAPISSGLDLLATQPGSQLNTPFGVIPFRGVPFQSASFGNADTIVARVGSLPPGGTGPIPVEIVALNLVSVNPIIVDLGGGPQPWDVWAVLNPLALPGIMSMLSPPPAQGQLAVTTHADPGGGVFNSFFDVILEVQLRPAGNPNAVSTAQFFTLDRLTGAGLWSHNPPPGYPSAPSGDFYVAPFALLNDSDDLLLLAPAEIPEPLTLSMVAAGLLLSCASRFRAACTARSEPGSPPRPA
jgi:hypothetical protein